MQRDRSPGELEWAYWRGKLRWDTTHYVYLVRGELGGPVKIGFAHDPTKRIRSIQTGYPLQLVLLRVIPGPVELEKGLHAIFASARFQGEWFDAEVIPYFKQLADTMRRCGAPGGVPPSWKHCLREVEVAWRDDHAPPPTRTVHSSQGRVSRARSE